MEKSDLDKERQLFDRCTALPAEQWDSFLDTECANDPALRQRLRSMLDHYRETVNEQGGFLRLDGRDMPMQRVDAGWFELTAEASWAG